MSYIVVLLLFGVSFASASSEEKVEDVYAQAFFDRIMTGYDARVPPVGKKGIGSPVHIYSSAYVTDVQKVDDYSMDFRAMFLFRQTWNDSRLAFNHLKDAKFTIVYVKDFEKIWKPDLIFNQEKEGELHKLTVPNVILRIHPSGEVFYSIRLSMVFSCKMDLRKFPFDTQHCYISAESFGHSADVIDVNWLSAWSDGASAVGFSKNITLMDFDLLNVTPSVETEILKISNEAKVYKSLQLNFTFQRKTGFFVLRLFVPFALLVIVSWLSFWIRPNFLLFRLTLLLSVLYLMVTIGNEINDYVTPAPCTKGSDVWISVCEALVYGSLLEFILVGLLAKTEKEERRKHRDNGDLVTGLDVEGKKDPIDKTESTSLSAKFDVKNLLRGSELSTRIDFISKLVFPLLFVFFNVIYWSVYCS